MSLIQTKNDVPVYTLQPLKSSNHYLLNIDNGIKMMLLNGQLTSVVWHVTQEFHKHNFWEICLVIRGSSMQRFVNKSEMMHPGSVYIMRPQDVHCISPLQPEMPPNMQSSPYIHRDIYIPVEKMKRICNALDKNLYDDLNSREYPVSAVLSIGETKRLESSLNYYTSQNEDFDFMHSVLVTHILCSVLENQRYAQKEYPQWLVQLLMNLDREDFMTKTVKEIIEPIGYNQSYICRQFKKYTEQTLVEYIHKRKCSYSLFLISNTETPIAQIAQRLQFADESAFIRTFKRIYGITPGQYRKKLSKELPSLDTDD